MGRPLGINAVLAAAVETTYGQTPASGFFKLPFVSHGLGEEQPLIEDDQLGFGREGLDPTYDVINNDGELVVPVDTRGIGFWLRQTFGAPTTSALGGGRFSHVFTSGAASLPTCSIERGHPDQPSYSVDYGAAVNQIRIGMARSGMLNAALSLICQGETAAGSVSAAGMPTARAGQRFAQATGAILVDGVAAAEIVGANIGYSNNLDKVETIRADGRIGGVDPGVARSAGNIDTRVFDNGLLNKANAKTPVALSFGWTGAASSSLTMLLPRVFLPRPKTSVSGPKGLMRTYNWQASGALAAQMTTTLVNDIASYA